MGYAAPLERGEMERIEYSTMDKSAWGPGPWQTEPDKIQFKDPETGLPCLIVRNYMGALCGYVGVSKGHPAFGKHYNEVEDLVPGDDYISAHGGLTFSDYCDEYGAEETSICHIPEPGEPDHVYWVGFDTAHYMDVVPRMEADNRRRYEETGDDLWRRLDEHGTYKTIGYVTDEIANLAKQLAALV